MTIVLRSALPPMWMAMAGLGRRRGRLQGGPQPAGELRVGLQGAGEPVPHGVRRLVGAGLGLEPLHRTAPVLGPAQPGPDELPHLVDDGTSGAGGDAGRHGGDRHGRQIR
ncbi:hypothetical protein [Streptomyces sp. MBT70]|nr:hypothetical protein [Streptomyces sp. MBT70]MBK3527601.1 hypothetical protein [Streptomyces sp. MBT70]